MRQDLLYYKWVVILKEKSAERYLPVYVGAPQGEIIKGLLEGTAPFRASRRPCSGRRPHSRPILGRPYLHHSGGIYLFASPNYYLR